MYYKFLSNKTSCFRDSFFPSAKRPELWLLTLEYTVYSMHHAPDGAGFSVYLSTMIFATYVYYMWHSADTVRFVKIVSLVVRFNPQALLCSVTENIFSSAKLSPHSCSAVQTCYAQLSLAHKTSILNQKVCQCGEKFTHWTIITIQVLIKDWGLTWIPLWMKPRRYRAGLRWGYSSVLVTLMPHTDFQAS